MNLDAISSFFSRRPTRTGVVFWCLFSVVAVFVRGVRWDENYEFAQVILDQIPFPEGHPLRQYVRGLYSLQPFGLAAIMHFAPGPLLANALRNILFLLCSTVPIYLWGTELSKRPLVGHCSVLLVLLGIHIPFYSSYPIHVWPGIFSNGPIGLGYMLFALWALASQRHRLAGCLLGFAPLVHLGQIPPLLACTVLYILWGFYQRRFGVIKQLLVSMIPGIAACVVFGLFISNFKIAPPTDGPYFSDAEPMVLWRYYMERYASHRAIPYTTGHLVLIGSLLIVAAAFSHLFLKARGDSQPLVKLFDRPHAWAAIYMVVATGTVWTIMAIHRALGADVPYILVGWLPYRLMNHVAPLLIPLLLTLAIRRTRTLPGWIPGILLAALFAPLLHLFMPVEVVNRYVDDRAYIFFFLFGAVSVSISLQIGQHARRWGIGAGVGFAVCLGILSFFHQFGALCVAAGALACLAPVLPGLSAHLSSRFSPRHVAGGTLCLSAVILAAMLAKDFERRQHLQVSKYHNKVARYLAHQGEEDAMILVPFGQVGMQMKTGHPVMSDMVTLLICPYRPEIGPSINAMFQDFYGISLDPETPAPGANLAWHRVWPAKSMEDWQRLSKKYDFRYVSTPYFMRLPLEQVVAGREGTLFRIPEAAQELELGIEE
jgi:hypothetical protein